MIAYLVRTVRLGFKSLLLHKLRAFLAVLGIMIGVTAVIWLVALGEGVSNEAQRQIKELGATNIIVKSQKPATSTQTANARVVMYGLTRDDYTRILEVVPEVRRAVPMREISCRGMVEGRAKDIQLLGVTEVYQEINRLEMLQGRFLSSQDSENLRNVCVIAPQAAQELFLYENPVGRTLQVNANNKIDLYEVVGVTAKRQASAAIGGSFAGRSYDRDVYIPIETFRARIGDQVVSMKQGTFDAEKVELNQVTLMLDDVNHVDQASKQIEILLKKFHKGVDDYSVTVPKELLQQAEMMRSMFNILLIIIAGISLLVGGIGIMNIMLATVTERTREIGIRRALGATQSDIIAQFLSETVALTSVGGLVGVAFGYAVYPVVEGIKRLAEGYIERLPANIQGTVKALQPDIATWSVVVAFFISVIVGVLFGIYPARRAAKMDPIEALRHE